MTPPPIRFERGTTKEIEAMPDMEARQDQPVGRVHDPALGEKLAHLEGLIGYRFPAWFFRKKHLASVLRVSAPQLSRKLTGDDPVHYRELSCLIDMFGLGPALDYRLFLLDPEAFRQALSAAGIGARPARDARQALYGRRTTGQPRVRIRKVGSVRRNAGIGPRTHTDDMLVRFAAHDEIYIDIDVPGAGELLVLNERLGKEMYWLRPSGYSTAPVVGASVFRIPDHAGPSSAFWARPPLDYYRLYAIWLASGHAWGALPASDGGDALNAATDPEIAALDRHLDHVPANRQMVMVADYQVR